MKPSEERQLAILKFLANLSTVSRNDLNKLAEQTHSLFSTEILFQTLEEMDSKHQDLLQLTVSPTLGPVPMMSFNSKHRWLTSKGDDRLYLLTHPEEEKPKPANFNFNAPITANGQQTFGNITSQSVDNSIHTSSTWNTDNSIHQLLQVKAELLDPSDQQSLEELAQVLKATMDSTESPKPGFLSKFSGFLNKTWKIVNPVVAPFLVELAKRTFIG